MAPLRRRRRRHRYYYFFYYVYVSGAHCGACASLSLVSSRRVVALPLLLLLPLAGTQASKFNTSVCVSVYVYVCMNVCMHMNICTYLNTDKHAYVRLRVCVRLSMWSCRQVGGATVVVAIRSTRNASEPVSQQQNGRRGHSFVFGLLTCSGLCQRQRQSVMLRSPTPPPLGSAYYSCALIRYLCGAFVLYLALITANHIHAYILYIHTYVCMHICIHVETVYMHMCMT